MTLLEGFAVHALAEGAGGDGEGGGGEAAGTVCRALVEGPPREGVVIGKRGGESSGLGRLPLGGVAYQERRPRGR